MQNNKDAVVKEIISWIKTIVFAVLFALFITQVVIVNAKVPTGSMMDNIMPGDRLIALRLAYLRSGPKRFDIVVFRFPDDRKELYVKRVIGLPGETVAIKAGKVYIDNSDVPLDDSFVREPPYPEDFGPVTVPAGSYFMMGDNRNNSADSRVWNNKFVVQKDILGKVLFKYFPGFKILYNT
jgi:signal peptidase I